MLGQKLIKALQASHKVLATSKGPYRIHDKKSFEYKELDVTSEFAGVKQIINDFRPDVVINTAAMTNVDFLAKINKKPGDKLNVDAVQYLADACAKVGAHLVQISTDFIFDGEAGPYKEDAEANPLSHYGLSKWKSEQLCKNTLCDWVVLRTIVYGTVDNLSRGNIVLWGRGALIKGDPLNIIDDQFRTPTLAEDLAQACQLAIEKKGSGSVPYLRKRLYEYFRNGTTHG